MPDGRVPEPDAAPTGGFALDFDGFNDFVRVQRQVDGDFTLEAWIKTTASLEGTMFWHGLGVIYADVPLPTNDFGTSILNGHFAFGIGPDDDTIQSTTTVTTGEWIHVAAVRERASGIIRVMVNGAEEASAVTTSTGLLNEPLSIDLGGNTIDGRYFAGAMDEVRIWNRARTATDIQSTMHQRLDGTEPGLVGYWQLDEGSGASARDSSLSRNDGSLGNGDAIASPRWIVSDAPLL